VGPEHAQLREPRAIGRGTPFELVVWDDVGAGDHVYGLGRADLCLGIEDHDAQLGALRQVA
jgi:hypothetical protein